MGETAPASSMTEIGNTSAIAARRCLYARSAAQFTSHEGKIPLQRLTPATRSGTIVIMIR